MMLKSITDQSECQEFVLNALKINPYDPQNTACNTMKGPGYLGVCGVSDKKISVGRLQSANA